MLALVPATRKLPHYFHAHTMYVLTEYPLQSLLRRLDFTGRIANWGTRLKSFDVKYKPRNSIKGQVFTNFVTEFNPSARNASRACQVLDQPWKVHVDGASNARGSGIGIILFSLEDVRVKHSLRLCFQASNNEAEYEALISGLRAVRKLDAEEVEIFSDSRLIVN